MLVLVVVVATAGCGHSGGAAAPSSPTHPLTIAKTEESPSSRASRLRPQAVRLTTVRRGADPRIAYAGPRGYVRADGRALSLPSGLPPPDTASLPMSFAPFRGGLLVAGSDLVLQRLTAGARRSQGCWAGYPVISPDARHIAWATRSRCSSAVTTVHEQSINAGPERSRSVSGRLDTVGVLHSGVVVSASPLSRPRGAWVVHLRHCQAPNACGPTVLHRSIPELASAGGVDERAGLVTGQSLDSHGHDGVLVTGHDGRVLWTTPGWHLGRFSRSGTYIVGWRFEVRGQVIRLGVFRRDSGRLVRAVDNLVDEAFSNPLDATAWEDDHDLLVIAEGKNSARAIIRIPAHGAWTRATPVLRVARPGDPGFAFSARP